MKLKVGDKLLCKKSFDLEDYEWFNQTHCNATMLIKGTYYLVSDIETRWYTDSAGVYIEGMEFHIGEKTQYKMMLENYFYTKKEIRKIKLEKIENR